MNRHLLEKIETKIFKNTRLSWNKKIIVFVIFIVLSLSLLLSIQTSAFAALTSWTQRNSATADTLHHIAYGNGIFAAMGLNGTIVTSTDSGTENVNKFETHFIII
ncbi:MAG: hypothetical protein HQL01_14380 [Nitrospirae bacterium]|nr:hypothetical protein [Nitrospirota bacterium]